MTPDQIERYAVMIEALSMEGKTIEEIAKEVGRSVTTLKDNWRKKYPRIAEAMAKRKLNYVALLTISLMKQALGYKTKTVSKQFVGVVDPITKRFVPKPDAEIIVRETEQEIPPNFQATVKLLHNLRSEFWNSQGGENGSNNLIQKFFDELGSYQPDEADVQPPAIADNSGSEQKPRLSDM